MPDEPAPAPRPRAAQDRKITDLITSAHRRLTRARTDAELAAFLAGFGYDAARLDAGDQLTETAQASFDARQNAVATRKAHKAAFDGARKAALRDYTAFRRIARRLFPQAPAATALHLAGDVPDDLDQFVTHARSAYAAAASAPHATSLATYGYPTARLAAHAEALNALLALDDTHRRAFAEATAATARRDADAGALAAYVNLLRDVLRSHPALLARLDAP